MVPIALEGFDFQPSVFGILELVNDQGGRVCLVRKMRVSVTYQRTSLRDLIDDDLKFGLLNCLKDLDTLGARAGVPSRYTASTSQGNG